MTNGSGAVALDGQMKWMEWCAVYLIVTMVGLQIFITLAPYFGLIPKGEIASLSQQQSIMQNVFIGIVSFLIGASVGTRKKDDAINTAINTAATAATVAVTQTQEKKE